jgi:hypothetical protein
VLHRDHRAQDGNIQHLAVVGGAGLRSRLQDGIDFFLGAAPMTRTLDQMAHQS